MNRLALAAGLHYTADLFPGGAGEGWIHDRAWSLDPDLIIGRVRALKAKLEGGAAYRNPSRLAQEMPLQTLLMNFQGLGDNCEFGLVQRQAGAEPLDLLRFASPHVPVENRPEAITAALKKKFVGLGEPGTIRLMLEGQSPPREIVVRESAYQLLHHTFVREGEVDLESFRDQEAKRLIFLRDKLLADLASAEKIWVWKSNFEASESQIAGLLGALTDYGSNVLLWVAIADATHPPGSVERKSASLLRGQPVRSVRKCHGYSF
jgi:hypothetical protein